MKNKKKLLQLIEEALKTEISKENNTASPSYNVAIRLLDNYIDIQNANLSNKEELLDMLYEKIKVSLENPIIDGKHRDNAKSLIDIHNKVKKSFTVPKTKF